MKIWLITIGEPVPVSEGDSDRLHRTGYFAHFLSEKGHEVTWWTSTFDHFRKKHFFSEDTVWDNNKKLRVNLLHSYGYSRNLSFSRIFDHYRIGRKFAIRAKNEQPPDIILASFPTIELCLEAVKYGITRNVPVVLDMRDMWPDVFAEAVPQIVRPIAQAALLPYYRAARKACSGATAITGITEEFVKWGVERGGRSKRENDRAFPMAYVSKAPPAGKIIEADSFWESLGVTPKKQCLNVCFFGTLGRQLDLDTVIMAAHLLGKTKRSVRFIICGTGDRQEHFKSMAAGTPNIVFPGWVNAVQIYALMRRCAIGIDPLPDRYDFLATINNKAIEYLSAGLPIVSSPDRGVLADLLRECRCGESYPQGNAEALADILERLYDDKTSLREMSENAVYLFRERFTAERVYAEMMEYLLRIAKTKRVVSRN